MAKRKQKPKQKLHPIPSLLAQQVRELQHKLAAAEHHIAELHDQVDRSMEQTDDALILVSGYRAKLIEHQLLLPRPRDELADQIELLRDWMLRLPDGRIVGGCQVSWLRTIVTRLDNDAVQWVLRVSDQADQAGGVTEPGAIPERSDITVASDPRCPLCKQEQPLEAFLDYYFAFEAGAEHTKEIRDSACELRVAARAQGDRRN